MSIRLRYSFFVATVFVWSLIGFPFLASTANVLGVPTSGIVIAARAAIALLCTILLAIGIANYRSPGSVTFRLLLLFFALYILRIAYDTTFIPESLAQPVYFYWAFAIGASFLPALTLAMFARYLDFARIYLPLTVMGVLVLAFAIAFGGTEVQNTTGQIYDTGRLALESLNPISLGHVGATVVVMIYWRLRLLPFKAATLIMSLAAAVLGLYGVFASGSRGPLVALICAVLFFEAVKGGRTLILLALFSAPVLAVLTVDVSQFETMLGTSIFSRFETALSGGDNSSLARVDQLGSAWALFLERPIFGAALEDPAYGIYPHNIVVEAFMALGIFGGVLLIVLLASTSVRAFRLARSNPAWSACGALFIQYMVGAQLSGGLSGSSVMWALIGCIAGVRIPSAVRQGGHGRTFRAAGLGQATATSIAAPGRAGVAVPPPQRQTTFTGLGSIR